MNMIQTERGSEAIQNAFSSARKEGRRALVGFLTVGYPSPKHTPEFCQALIDGGVDILELGVPFSDPIADGPLIQSADTGAIAANTTMHTCFEIARSIKRRNNIPLVFLTYYNPILKMRTDKFLKKASEVVEGVIVPDLPEIGSREFTKYKELARKNGLASILLAAPTTRKEWLKLIKKETSGFLYLVSLLGVTGSRRDSSESNHEYIKRVCKSTRGSPPVAVGFGISSPEHVREILKTGADGVIVGSAFVNVIRNNPGNPKAASISLQKLASRLRAATYVASS